jgi:2,4-dienoyl-CoA reductase-like NADH-dependent reductase (Old Yellow Enzyme family)/thioredoxin reductase
MRCFEKMFESAFMGTLEVKNRVVMAPMATRLASENGAVTQRLIDYYVERAKGGVGTIITEAVCFDYPLGAFSPNNLRIHHNSHIAGHNELVEFVHAYGTKILCLLWHPGRNNRLIEGRQPVAPSAIPCKWFNVIPKELTVGEIENLVRDHIEAAVRAKTAGYDGVEVQGAHGYLIGQFMSASSNHREDCYGGDLNKRMQFPLDIIRGIRKELGPNYLITFRLNGDDFVNGGTNLEESKKAAKILEDAGVDVLDVSAGTYDSMTRMIEPMSYPQGWRIYLAEEIRKVVKIPVIGVGVIRTPEFAEKILEEGKVNFVALGRALLADPYWPEKAREGRQQDIVPCISCNDCFCTRLFRNLQIRCTVNPLAGRERLKDTFVPVVKRKKVSVIGGGPAGMMAALTASMRGHQVILYERNKELGGQLQLAKIPQGKEAIAKFHDYLLNQIEDQRVEINLGHPATQESIIQNNPDVVIIATGAIPLIPQLEGIESRSVCTAWQVLAQEKIIRDNVVLVAGGGTVGCETALYLSPQNKKVIIVEMLGDIALDMDIINRMDLISRIEESEIEVLTSTKIDRIAQEGVVVSTREMKEELIKVDIVVLALGVIPVRDLVKNLEGKIKEVHIVGDGYTPRKLAEAVHEGFLAATTI